MKQIICSLLLLVSAADAKAAPLTADAFEAYTSGQTFYFSQDGQDYGGERYLPDRRVEWSFLDGKCKTGHWYPEDGAICFVYEDNLDPQCWFFSKGPKGLEAKFKDSDVSFELYEARRSDTPLLCLGPEVGV